MMAAVAAAAFVPSSLTSIFAFWNILETNIFPSASLLKSVPGLNIVGAPRPAITSFSGCSTSVVNFGSFRSTLQFSILRPRFAISLALTTLIMSSIDLPSFGRRTVIAKEPLP